MKQRLSEHTTGPVGIAALGCLVERSSTVFSSSSMKDSATPQPTLLEAIGRRVAQLKSLPPILAATLREIFDESAYARFLKQRQLVSSRAAYAAFRQEHEVTKARRPRCC